MRASPVDNGGQGCSKRVMSNQSSNLGEPPFQGDGSLRHPASVGEPGFVYFIRAGRTANVKIGWAKDPYARLEALQCGSPHKLHLIGYFCGSHSDEKALHYTWAAARSSPASISKGKQHDGSRRAGGCGAMASGDVESADLGKRVFVARTAVLRMVGTAKSQRKHGGYAARRRQSNRGRHPHYGEKRWGDRQ